MDEHPPVYHWRDSDEADLFDRPLVDRLAGGDRFVARDWLRDRVQAELDRDDCRFVLVTGSPGAGKSTLMAWLAAQHPTWPRYFIRRSGETDGDRHVHEGGLASFLTVIGLQLARASRDVLEPAEMIHVYQHIDKLGGRAVGVHLREVVLNPFQDLARSLVVTQEARSVTGEMVGVRIDRLIVDAHQEPAALAIPALFAPAARLAAADPGHRIVILVDGLDELQFRNAPSDVGRWLADMPQPPPNVRFVVFSRPTEARVADLRAAHGAAVGTVDIDADPARAGADIERYVRLIATDDRVGRVLAAHGIHPDRFVAEVTAKAAGNFQYVTFLARTLERHAVDTAGPAAEADLDWLRRLPDLPDGLDRLYGHFLDRVRRDAGPRWEPVHLAVLGLLTVARAPLTARQMETLGGVPAGASGSAPALAALRPFLARDAAGGYRLYHGSVGDFIVSDPGDRPDLHCRPEAAHRLLTDRAQRAHGPTGSWKAADGYLRRNLAAHAAAAGRLDELLHDPRFLVAAEPSGLLDTIGEASGARAVARLYRQVVAMLRNGAESAALAHLELYARQEGIAGFAESVVRANPGHSWSTGWTHWLRGSVRQLLGEHGSEVTTIAATAVDGRPVAVSGGRDGRLVVWDLIDGASVATLTHGHGGDRFSTGVTALATGELPNGDPILVSGGRDGMAQVWSLRERSPIGAPLAGIENAGSVAAVGETGGRPLLVCTAGASARVWDLAAGAPVGPPVAATGEAAAVAMCAGRLLFAVANSVFDARTGRPVGVPLPQRSGVCGVALGELDGVPLAAVSDWEGDIGVWNPVTGDLWGRPVERAIRRAYGLAIGRLAGRTVLAVGLSGSHSGDCRIRLWDLAGRGWIGEPIAVPGSGELFTVAFAPAGDDVHLVAAGTAYQAGGGNPDPTLWRWRLASPAKADSLRAVDGDVPTGRNIKSVTVVPGARTLVFGAGGKVTWWDAATGEERGTTYFPREDWHAAQQPVDAVAVAETGGRTVVVGGVGQTVRRWDIADGNAWGDPLTGDPRDKTDLRDIAGIVVGRIDHRPVVACANGDRVRVWDLATGEPAGPGTFDVGASIDSLGATELDGRGVLVVATRNGVQVRDLDTGALSARQPPGDRGQFSLAMARHDDHLYVVSAHNGLGAIRVWDTALPDVDDRPYYLFVDEDPSVIKVQAHIAAMAAVELDDELVAVHSGYRGTVRVTDLTGHVVQPTLATPTTSLAVTTVAGQAVVVCGGDDGIRVLDLDTGDEAFPPPTVEVGEPSPLRPERPPKVSAVAVGEVDGRPVGVYQGPVSIRSWYLDTGEPTAMPALAAGEVSRGLSVGRVGDRPVVIRWAERGATIHVTDLATGEPAVEPVTDMREITATATANFAGADLLVYARSGTVRSRYLRWTAADEQEARDAHDILDRGETPPEGHRVGERLTGGNVQRIAFALGDCDGVPVVVAGHEEGDVYVYTVSDALPVLDHPCQHPGTVTAVAFGDLGGRPVLVSGGEDGTVCVWDPADGALISEVRTLAWVSAVALAPPDRIVVATVLGTLALRLDLPAPAAGARSQLLPVNVRGARHCPRHGAHVEVREIDGEPAVRVCVKGVQLGGPQFQALAYGLGHCYVFPGRIVVADRTRPDDDATGLELFLRRAYIETQDVPHAYQYDGGHYRLRFDQPRHQRDICCYTRADRDRLGEAIAAARGGRPKRPFDDIV